MPSDPHLSAPTPEGSVEDVPSGRGIRGPRVLLILFLAPLVIVPLLLTGRATERQVCLVTLEQRTVSVYRVGGIAIGEQSIEPVAGWPSLSPANHLPERLAPSPAATPAEATALLYGDAPPSHRWTTARRTLPFAFVVGIEARDALLPQHANMIDAKLLSLDALDLGAESDRAVLATLWASFDEGEVTPAEIKKSLRRRKLPPETPGELRARAFIDGARKVVDGDDPDAGLRALALKMAAETP